MLEGEKNNLQANTRKKKFHCESRCWKKISRPDQITHPPPPPLRSRIVGPLQNINKLAFPLHRNKTSPVKTLSFVFYSLSFVFYCRVTAAVFLGFKTIPVEQVVWWSISVKMEAGVMWMQTVQWRDQEQRGLKSSSFSPDLQWHHISLHQFPNMCWDCISLPSLGLPTMKGCTNQQGLHPLLFLNSEWVL